MDRQWILPGKVTQMRTHWAPRRVATTMALLVTAGLALTGCSGDQKQEQPPQTTAPGASVQVSDAELGPALDALVAPGTPSADDGACLATAAGSSDLSQEALAHIVARGGDDLAAVAASLSADISESAGEALLDPQLREEFDACVDAEAAAVRDGQRIEDLEYEPAPAPEAAPEAEPVTEPKYPVDDEEIRSPQTLSDGVISMFTSYADTEDEKQAYIDASQCLAEAIYTQDFSQETLHFIAGGAPLGSGAIIDHLATKEDKQIWTSNTFKTSMVDCVEAGDREDEAAPTG